MVGTTTFLLGRLPGRCELLVLRSVVDYTMPPGLPLLGNSTIMNSMHAISPTIPGNLFHVDTPLKGNFTISNHH